MSDRTYLDIAKENLISNVAEMYKEYVNEFEEDEQENNLEI